MATDRLKKSLGAGLQKGILSFLFFTSVGYAADLNVLIVGSTGDSTNTGNVSGTSSAFDPTSVRTYLQNILQGAGLGTVNVEVENRGSPYDLASWFHYPLPAGVETTTRWPKLRGELGTKWNYVIVIGDPYSMENMPGLYAHGVSMVAQEVAKGGAETVLLMPWPSATSTSTVAHYKEVVYRAGRSGPYKVAPAALAWQAAGSPRGTTHPNADGAFIAAASVYSTIWNQSASASTYVYNDTLANTVHTSVTTNNSAVQYSGNFSFQNPFLMLGDKRRDVHFSEKGTSTEQDFKGSVGAAMDRARVTYNSGSYSDKYNSNTPADDGLGWPSTNPMPIAWNHGRKFSEAAKEYVTNPSYWQLGMGFMYQYNTWADTVESANDTHISQIMSHDIYLAGYMRSANNMGTGQHSTARSIPWRLIWAQIHHDYPTLNPLRDGTGPHLNNDLHKAVGTYMYTMYSGRCPLDPQPNPITTTWFAQKVGYETAWRLGRCQTRAPGFKVLPSAASKKTILGGTTETMTVQFILPPQSNVTVNISSSNTSAATVSPSTLTFTPANYSTAQSITVTALSGLPADLDFDVVFNTVSTDEAYNNLNDSWRYTAQSNLPTVAWTVASQISASESGTMTVTAQLSAASSQAVTVPFTVSGTATGADYTITASPITIAAGATTGSAAISITNDSIHELNGETVILTMGTPTNAKLGATTVHTATIRDDDNIAPVVNAGPDQTVTLSGSSTVPLTPAALTTTAWYDASNAASIVASGGAVSQWKDLSGSNNHLAQATTTAQPTTGTVTINGLNAIDFDGTSDKMAMASNPFAPTINDAMIIMVHKVKSITAQGVLFSLSGSETAANRWQSHAPWSDGTLYFDTGGSAAPGRISAAYGAAVNDVSLISYYGSITNNVQQVYKNGTLLVGDASGHAVMTAGNPTIGGMSAYQNTSIAEIVVIKGTVSSAVRQQLEGYLAHKWGLAANLPAGHPYKSAAPTTSGSSVTANLDGTVSDGNNDPLTTTWTLVSGPAPVTIGNASLVDTTATFTVPGVYTLRLTANDSYGLVSDDVVITVNSTGGTYTVTYNGNGSTGGTVPVDGSSYASGATVTVLGNTGSLVRTGYTFGGWNTAANGTGTSYAAAATFTITANTTLYAKWTPNTYTVTYNANGATSGTVPANQTKTQDVALTLATNSGNLARTGYTFAGWNTAANGSGTDYAAGASYTANAAVTLYAKWTPNTYTVTYNANGATSGTVPANQTKTQDVALTLATNSGNLARTGYTFAGWNTAANGSGTDYAVGASYTANAAVTLYAKWTPNTYTVSYNANGATSGTVPANQTKTQDVALTLATNSGNLARTGYTFAGWNTAANGTGTNYAAGASYTANAAVTLYAKWTVISTTYTVTYSGNGATGGTAPVDGNSYASGATVTVLGNTGSLVRTGYTFGGWNTTADGTGTSYAAAATFTITANTTLYAKWTVVNIAPVASNLSISTSKNTTYSGMLTATDANGDLLTFSIVTNGSKGLATITNAATGAFTYTPFNNQRGTDTFTFKVNDGKADSNIATVTVTITNNKPNATNTALSTTGTAPISATMIATDADGDSLTWEIVINGTKGTAQLTDTSSGAFTYTANPGETGTDTITFRVTDGFDFSNLATVTITINSTLSINSAPQAVPNPAAVGAAVQFTVTASGTDPLVYSWEFGDSTIGDGAAATHSYSAAGIYTAKITVTDSSNQVASATVQVVVIAGGSPTDDTDGDGIPDAFDDDDDNDGVSDINELADGTDPHDPHSVVKTAFQLLKLTGTVKFSFTGKDSCSVSGTIPSLPAGFKPQGLVATVDIGGATRSFTLDAKGRARAPDGTFGLKLKMVTNKTTKAREFPGGSAPFKARLSHGAWMSAWSDEGADPQDSVSSVPMQIVIDVMLGGRVYTFTANTIYSSKAAVGGKFKK